jgi:multiple sugar transport system permease protein/raffinose/stachyose/melibiose transport system permease protein
MATTEQAVAGRKAAGWFRRLPGRPLRPALNRQFSIAMCFMLPGLLAFVLFVAYPLVATLVTSFFSIRPRGAVVQWNWVGLDWFREALFEDRTFRRAMLNTGLWALWSVVVDIPLAFGLAYALRSRVKGWQVFRTAWFIPILLSPVLTGLLWRSILRLDGGMLNAFLELLHLGQLRTDWLGRPTALVWLFIMTSWQTVGFYMILILAALEDFSEELLDAARIDGTNRFQQVVYIILPVLRPVLVTITILAFIYKMRVFDLVWVTTQGGPFGRTETVVTWVVQRAFYYQGAFNLGYPAAMSTIWLIAMALGVWGLKRLLGGNARGED